MRRILAASIPLTVAVVLASASPTAAQNPFQIGGPGNVIPDAGTTNIPDPTGNTKELGPLNSNTTKIGPINADAVPTLGFTNPNGQVDLVNAWLDTRQALDGDTWLYFAWQRDANSGSGFISIEFQQSGLPNGCVYEGVDFADEDDPETIALIEACNPWANRQTGDFIILWDQQGNTLDAFDDIKKRTFTCVNSGCTLGPIEDLESVEATISADRFFGEMAINLTDEVFGEAEGCLTFANVIPGTVTGNSDTADYKDTIHGEVQPISNCGVMKVKKVTVGSDGVTPQPDPITVFSYRVFRADSSALRFPNDVDDHPEDGPDPQTQILRPNGSLTNPAPGIKDGETQTHTDLITGTNYRLVEPAPGVAMPANYELVSIICTDGSANSPVNITPPIDGTDTFQIQVGEETECVITNKFVPTAPSLTTEQGFTVSLNDLVNITGLQAQPAGSRAANVIFRLYSNATCTTELTPAAGISAAITYNTEGTEGSASSGNFPVTVQAGVATTFYWRVFYPGDGTKNLAADTPCGLETTTVTISKNDSGGSLP
jgi:hypothetical protein